MPLHLLFKRRLFLHKSARKTSVNHARLRGKKLLEESGEFRQKSPHNKGGEG